MPSGATLPCDLSFIPSNTSVLVAVSGGADSLALLLALRKAKLPIMAGHVNHGLRGIESDADEAFVLKLCEELNIAAHSRRVQLASSSEDAARHARYTALVDIAKAHNCGAIATGHTADDQLETVLLNWLRGAAVAGLAGIPACREFENLLLVRPLLSATRRETRAFCEGNGFTWCEDASNATDIYTRNRVRELLPLLAQAANVSPEQLARQTNRAALLWREESEFLDALAQEKLQLLTLQEASDLLVINGLRFSQLPPPLGRRILRLAAQSLSNAAREIGSEPVEAARRHIASGGRHAVWQWPGGISVEWTGALSGNRIRVRFVRQQTETQSSLENRF